MELLERPWRNNRGYFFDLAGNEVLGAHLAELKPGGHSTRHRHTTEAYIYIVKGYGYSLINYDDEPVQRVDWSEGTLLSPPRWAWHQHFDLDTADTARYLAIQDTGLLRTLRLHQIERHPTQLPNPQVASTRQEDGSKTQLVQGDGTEYTVDAVAADAVPADEADDTRR